MAGRGDEEVAAASGEPGRDAIGERVGGDVTAWRGGDENESE